MNSSLYQENQKNNIWPVSIAPMMKWTDRYYRYFMRQITKCTLLYTEMIGSGAVLHGSREKLLGFAMEEKPLALQIGGDDPKELSECARIVEDYGYNEINLNVGCPSERVQKGNFGACLMAEPELVRDCLKAMKDVVSIPVTVKQRIGIDGQESYDSLAKFVEIVAESGCDRFIVHSRIAVLKGLSPKDNRTIPPLRYEDVYQLKKDYPDLIIEINGGIKSIEDITPHLQFIDGVMVGRAAYENPYMFAEVDSRFYNENPTPKTRRQIVEAMIPYIDDWANKNVNPQQIIHHMLNLFAHQPGTKRWKGYLSENAHKPEVDGNILVEAMKAVSSIVLDEVPTLSQAENLIKI
jgi:tRNA-dihydrouridine synthase A